MIKVRTERDKSPKKWCLEFDLTKIKMFTGEGFFLLQTHIITYSALNLLTKQYNTYSTDKYKKIQHFSRLLTVFTMRCLHYIAKVTLTL